MRIGVAQGKRAWLAHEWPRPKYMARIIVASVALVTWGAFSFAHVASAWLQEAQQVRVEQAGAAQSQPAAVSPASGASLNFSQVLEKARALCPADRSVVVVSDGAGAQQLVSYFIYPRKATFVGPGQPFGEADLAAYSGLCLVDHGDASIKRLVPLRSHLETVACSSEGCLYLMPAKPR